MDNKPENSSELSDHVCSYRAATKLTTIACFILPVLYIFGLIDSGPLDWAQALGFKQPPQEYEISTKTFQAVDHLIYVTVNAGLFAVLSMAILVFFRERIAVYFVGSREAVIAAINEIHRKESTPVPLGTFISVIINRGGFMSSDESTIETTLGFYRVLGKAGGILKGAEVSRLGDSLQVATCNDAVKKYTLIE